MSSVCGFPSYQSSALGMLGIQMRQLQTSAVQRDIDQAAKYIGAGAATVGVAGSGSLIVLSSTLYYFTVDVLFML